MNQLGRGWPAERNSAENEGSGIVGKLLAAILPFLADNADGLNLARSELGETKR